jgi:tRNA uridine 5-carboxymethylaminomethyl modification enzyme
MFTSRAEYRLLLREDNADRRLTPAGRRVGLVADEPWARFEEKMAAIATGRERLRQLRISPGDSVTIERLGLETLKNGVALEELLRRPEIVMADVAVLDPELAALAADVQEQLEIDIKYAGYIERQAEQVERFRRGEGVAVPADFNYDEALALSAEVREKLKKIRPTTLGQLARVPGVTPAAVAIMSVLLKRH